jgi:hypothetical protein
MRTTIIILTFLTLIACKNTEKKNISQNDRLELVPEPDMDLREKHEQAQNISINC